MALDERPRSRPSGGKTGCEHHWAGSRIPSTGSQHREQLAARAVVYLERYFESRGDLADVGQLRKAKAALDEALRDDPQLEAPAPA